MRCSRCASGGTGSPTRTRRTADDTDGAPVKPLPRALADLGRRAVVDSYGDDHPFSTGFELDAAIVNLYAPGAHLGLHQDGEEPSAAPVVTISLGDDCVFRMAGVDRRTSPFTDVVLHSGDLLVFAGREPSHLPRRPEGAPGHRAARARPATRPAQHHAARNRVPRREG